MASSAQLAAHEGVAGCGDVALVEHEVHDREHRREPVGELVVLGHAVGDVGGLDLLLGPHDALGHGRLGHEEGPGDLGGLQPGDQPQREGHLHLGGEGGVAAGEDEAELVVGDGAEVTGFVGFVELHGLRLAVVPRGLSADLVDPSTAGRGDDPAGGGGREALLGPALERHHEGVLDRFLGEVDVAEEADQGRYRSSGLGAEDPLDLGRVHCGHGAAQPSGSDWNGRTSTVPSQACGRLGGERQGLVEVLGLDHPEATDVLLALEVRAVGDDVLALGVVDDAGGARALEASAEHPVAGGHDLVVEPAGGLEGRLHVLERGVVDAPRDHGRRAGTGSLRFLLVR